MTGMLEGKVALITGAAGGIGRDSALIFSREGAKVLVADVDADGGNETVELVKKAGGDAIFTRCDVSKASDVEAMVKKAVDTYGGLHCAFNNAGLEGDYARTADATEENFDLNYQVNQKGVWLCMKYEIRAMMATGEECAIVNTASGAGLIGVKNLSAYVAAKHAVVGLTKTAALEYATRKIRVNAVCPGPIESGMLKRVFAENPKMEPAMMAADPMNRLGKPSEIAEAALWLCSEEASFVTGHAMPVDGGLMAS